MRRLLALVLLSACADPPVQSFPGPDGNRLYSIHCKTQDMCLKRAGEACPTGYVDRYELKNKREMLIRCRGDLGDWKQ